MDTNLSSGKNGTKKVYRIDVPGKKAYMLNGRFRIALSFPDLMMGQFMTISSAPDSTEAIMKGVTSSGAQLSSN